MKTRKNRFLVLAFAFLMPLLCTCRVSAASGPFELTALEITDKSAQVEGDAVLNSAGEIENSIVFHHVGDYVDYKLTLKNTGTQSYTITGITDDNASSYLTYDYDNHAGETVAAGATFDLAVRVTYATAVTDMNARSQAAATKLNIAYQGADGSEGDESLLVPNTGDETTGGTSAKVAGAITGLVVFSVAMVVLLFCVTKKHKKSAVVVSIVALALSVSCVTLAEGDGAATGSEVEFTGTFDLKDKVLVSYDIDGEVVSQAADYETTVGDLTAPERQGYSFTRWYDGNNQNVSDDTVLSDDLVLFPYWTLKVAKFGGWCGDYCGYTRYNDTNYGFSSPRTMMKAASDLGLSISGTVADVFMHSDTKPSDEIIAGAKNIAASDSQYPVYMWYDTEANTIYWWSEAGKVSLPQYAKYLFYRFPARKVYLTNLDASPVRDMYAFFEESKVREVVFGDNFDTSNVYDMGAFFYASGFTTADFGNLDTSEVSYFDYMFGSTPVVNLDLSELDLSYGYSFKGMFTYMTNLTSLTLPETTWTSDGQDFTEMFKKDTAMEILDLSPLKYNTEYDEVCPSDVRDMFSYMTKLTTIYADPSFDFHSCGYDWTEPGFPPGENDKTQDYDIFWNDNLLVGGAGSEYKNVRPRGDYPYAGYDSDESGWYEPANEVILFRIDGGTTYTRGVFTAKP